MHIIIYSFFSLNSITYKIKHKNCPINTRNKNIIIEKIYVKKCFHILPTLQSASQTSYLAYISR